MTSNDIALQYPWSPVPAPMLSANALANARASADPRFNVKATDRPGLSRGRGAYANAGIRAAGSLSAGIASAYDQQAQDAGVYANQALQRGQNREQFAQSLAGLLSQSTADAQAEQLQRQGMLYGLIGQALG